MKRMPIPPDRPALYPLRDTSTGHVQVSKHSHGRRRITIDHQPLARVTPEMVHWWFQNIGGQMHYAGQLMQNYLVWHPHDHIHWALSRPAPGGGAAEGARFRIVEAFRRRPEWYVDTTDTVEKLDTAGIRLVRRILGVPVLQLEHTWSRCSDSTHYVSVLDVGARSWLMTPINRVLRRKMPDAMLEAWVTHNIEEVGLLEHLLPTLCDRSGQPLPTLSTVTSEVQR